MSLSTRDRNLLAAHAVVSERTVVRLYSGASTHSSTRERIVAAAQQLGLPQPPVPSADKKAA
jgi:DNA-binding LacI/PurR family transcriptional regulator